ncbi:MAG: DUF1016 N-terminal domain-containing protein [Bacteroidia bacterium]
MNQAMVRAYWMVGKRIVEVEQGGKDKAAYGEQVLKGLSALSEDFGKGFSYANLRNFRQFYRTYPDLENSHALRSNLSWSQHRFIMRVESPAARDYYLKECESQGWSAGNWARNIETFAYQRLLQALVNPKPRPHQMPLN